MSKGVYIQDIDGKLWKAEEWDDSTKPNAIAVIGGKAKFLIALKQLPLLMQISSSAYEPLEDYMASLSISRVSREDYDGAVNTASILKIQSNTSYAAGYCNSFTFPDGKTKGFLPSFGQINLAYRNKVAIEAALSKCGGTAMTEDYYWTSTFWGVYDNHRYCWLLYWSDGNYRCDYLNNAYYVRPFADFN